MDLLTWLTWPTWKNAARFGWPSQPGLLLLIIAYQHWDFFNRNLDRPGDRLRLVEPLQSSRRHTCARFWPTKTTTFSGRGLTKKFHCLKKWLYHHICKQTNGLAYCCFFMHLFLLKWVCWGFFDREYGFAVLVSTGFTASRWLRRP